MPHGERILKRELLRWLSRGKLGVKSVGVKRASILKGLAEADPNGGTPAQCQKRTVRLLDRYFHNDGHIEKVRHGTALLKVEPWLETLVRNHKREISESLDHLREFLDEMDAKSDPPPSLQGDAVKRIIEQWISSIVQDGVGTGTDLPAPSSSSKGFWHRDMRFRRALGRTNQAVGTLKKEIRRRKGGRVPRKYWESFLSELSKEWLEFLSTRVAGNPRPFHRKVQHSVHAKLAELSVALEGMTVEELLPVFRGVIDDFVVTLDRLCVAGPHAHKSYRDPRLHLSGWTLLRGLLNNLVSRKGPP